jgi:hypothetical protein
LPKYIRGDEFLTEFVVSKQKSILTSSEERLDPDNIPFSQPDFGFDYDFEFNDAAANGGAEQYWKQLTNLVSLYPRYERVKNYIDFVN